MNELYVRFNLQDAVFSVQSEDFYSEKMMEASKEEIDKYTEECKIRQREMADVLKKEIDLSHIFGKKVLYLGDSITADRKGYRGITTYAADFKATNGAISGGTSTDMLCFIKSNIEKSDAEIISIMIGTNDSGAIDGDFYIVSPDEYRRNIRELLRISKEKTDKIIISTLTPMNEEAFCRMNNFAYDGKHMIIGSSFLNTRTEIGSQYLLSVYHTSVHLFSYQKNMYLMYTKCQALCKVLFTIRVKLPLT